MEAQSPQDPSNNLNSGTPVYQSVLAGSPDAVITMSLDGKIIDWSDRAETLLGWQSQQAIGKLLGSLLIPAPYRDAHWNGLERFRKTGQSRMLNQRLQLTALHRDGREIPIELWLSQVQQGNERLIAGFLRDRTNSAEAQQSSRRRTIETRLVQQASTLSVVTGSFDEAMRKCLELMCSITGWPCGHALMPDAAGTRMNSTGIFHATDPQRYSTLLAIGGELSLTRGEGLAGRVWGSGQALWTADVQQEPALQRIGIPDELNIQGAFAFPVIAESEVVAILEFFSSVEIAPDPQLLLLVDSLGTQLGRIVERHQWDEERAHLASIVDSSYDAIIGKDIAGNIISWNAGAEQVYGYTAEEAIGHSIAIILPLNLVGEEPEVVQALKTGRRLTQFETLRRRKDNSEITVSLTVSPLRDSNGRIVGSSTIERDITKRRQREQDFEKARREAVAARNQAESANKTKTEFLANISHELRTPMNAIIGMLELALGEELNPVMRDYLHTARDSADTLLYLLDDLLDFSRIEAGRLDLENDPFDIQAVIDATVKTLSLKAHEKGLELAAHVDPAVPDVVRGDGNRLRQIVTNLTGNAIKFTEQGEVVVSISQQSRGDDTVELLLSVRDTGIGISADDQARIFTPFEQLDASTTRQQTGTGLGLAICCELVEKMKGRIWLESREGKGSTFYCTMRFGMADVADDSEEEIAPDLRGLRVLVADDNETNRKILAETLQAWSMRPTVMTGGREAIREVVQANQEGRPYPLIIVDALMPDTDGFTVVETLKQQETDDPATVLMLSSADRQTFQDRCENLDVDAFLEKPISQSDMHDAIMTALVDSNLESFELEQAPEQSPSRRILVAEDTPANQKVVKAILEKHGHSVEIAHNGREAIDRHQQGTFDVILMDVQMPTMDGFQATEAIRNLSDPQLAAIPIIAMTAHARREDRMRCLEAGMDAYISKPLDAVRLLKLVQTTNRQEASPSSQPQVSDDAVDTQHSLEIADAVRDERTMIDRDAAIQRMGGSTELFADVCSFFLEDAPELLATAERGLAEQNMTEVSRAAHSIKGLAGNFGAQPVIEAARRLEEAADEEQSGDLSAMFSQLQQVVEQLSNEVRALLP